MLFFSILTLLRVHTEGVRGWWLRNYNLLCSLMSRWHFSSRVVLHRCLNLHYSEDVWCGASFHAYLSSVCLLWCAVCSDVLSVLKLDSLSSYCILRIVIYFRCKYMFCKGFLPACVFSFCYQYLLQSWSYFNKASVYQFFFHGSCFYRWICKVITKPKNR